MYRTLLPPRPGVVLGGYPQKKESTLGLLEELMERGLDRAKQLIHARKYNLDEVVRQVNRHGCKLKGLSENVMDSQIAQLRSDLVRTGLKEDLIALSFAVIRELSDRTLGKRHFDVQLFGGWVMMDGQVAEMDTGQGKTLTAALASCTAALAGIPVHIITSNDYLASRDAELLKPLYDRLELSVGSVVQGMEPDDRRNTYACDIVHTTNKQIAFDYLRDRMEIGNDMGPLSFQFRQIYREQQASSENLLMRGLCFAIVDEADSVLIDEARTPLIISKTQSNIEQKETYREAVFFADALQRQTDFLLDLRAREITLTDQGISRLTELVDPLSGIWAGRRRREFLVVQALNARYFYQRDKHYIVHEGKIQIIDEQTGRLMDDRSWEQGLHQMIEIREGCEVTGQREPLARISYQRFFRRYLKLAGMSGTVKETAGELWSVYRLRVVKIPTHQPSQRRILPERLYITADEKWQALMRRVRMLNNIGRPILIGTLSVAESEYVSSLLTGKGIDHRVLNARQDQDEAEIVGQAGQRERVTVATNMAGRGTDIQLGPGVERLAGLHVIATQRNDSRRVDRQLYGRCGRQGDPGSTEAFLSLEDKSMALYYTRAMLQVLARIGRKNKPLPHWISKLVLALPQKRTERLHRNLRGRTSKLDEQLAKTLAFTGRLE